MQSEANINNNKANRIVFTNIDTNLFNKRKEEQVSNNKVSSKNENKNIAKNEVIENEHDRELNAWKSGEVPGVFLYRGNYFLADEAGIKKLIDTLKAKDSKFTDKHNCYLTIAQSGFGPSIDMDMSMWNQMIRMKRHEDIYQQILGQNEHLISLLNNNSEQNTKNIVAKMTPQLVEKMLPEFFSRYCNEIVYIPNVMLPKKDKESYILDNVFNALASPLTLFDNNLSNISAGLPSKKDIDIIASRSKNVCKKFLQDLVVNNVNIKQLPTSYGNYICTAVLEELFNDDEIKNIITLNDNTLILNEIPTSTYKYPDYTTLAKSVSNLLEKIAKNKNSTEPLCLEIRIASSDNNSHLNFHPFAMTKRFLYELNNCIKNTDIQKVNVFFVRGCRHLKKMADCPDCQEYDRCCCDMLQEKFIVKSNDNVVILNKDNQKEFNTKEMKYNVDFALDNSYNIEKTKKSCLGISYGC